GVDHLRGGQPGVFGDLGEVRAVVDDVDHDVGATVGRGHDLRGVGGDPHLAQPLPSGPLPAGAVELDQHRAGGGDEVDHAGEGGPAQGVDPRQYLGGAATLEHQRMVAVVENGVADQVGRQLVGDPAANVRHAHYWTVTPESVQAGGNGEVF